MAFKEWSVICAALGSGRQSLILRKGGIHEGRAGFQVEHSEFWLFPTNFHQSPDDLAEHVRDFWGAASNFYPPGEEILIRHYAVVETVTEITDESTLPRLNGLHGWSDCVVHDRFHYKRPGLFALVCRIYEFPTTIAISNLPHFAGCRSWVDLIQEFATAGLRPVLSDADHACRRNELLRRFGQAS